MILNRFAKALYDQNWFLVTIEVLVVIVGILVGLHIDSWNEDRKARVDELQYLQRLHQDVVLTEELSTRV